MQRNITKNIVQFRDFLVDAWPYLDGLMDNHDWEDDIDFTSEWLTVNWELLVEKPILEGRAYMTSFSCIPYEQRIVAPDMTPDYAVIGFPNNKEINSPLLRLYSFLTRREPSFGYYPPFDFAALVEYNTNKKHILPLTEVRFELIPLDDVEKMQKVSSA